MLLFLQDFANAENPVFSGWEQGFGSHTFAG